jgi:ankyrin repeat domain-containing protein 50
VTADPGCGKSVLARYLIDDVLPKDHRKVCYFFFKDDFEDQRNSLSAICSVLHQLFVSYPHLLTSDILEGYTSREEKFFQSFENLWAMFLLASEHQNVLCVLDALDECQEVDRHRLIEAVTGIRDIGHNENGYHGPRFLITSRPYGYIHNRFNVRLRTLMSSIHIQGDQGQTPDAIAREIELVLDSRIEEIAVVLDLEPDEEDLMKTKLGSVPNRTYLWITLIFDGLMDRKLGLTKADIVSLVEHLPQSVDDAYEKLLSRSPKTKDARRLLQIILGAARPLSLSEISIALAFEDGQSISSASDRIMPNRRIRAYVRDLCGLFAIVVDDKVYLLHQTAREFLVCKADENTSQKRGRSPFTRSGATTTRMYPWKHSISIADANAVLAASCLRYLASEAADENHPFFEYVALNWTHHYCQSPATSQADLGDLARDCCAISPTRELWATLHFKEHWPRLVPDTIHGTPPLPFASALAHPEIVRLLLPGNDTMEVDSENDGASSKPKRRRLLRTDESSDPQSFKDKADDYADDDANHDGGDEDDKQKILDEAMWYAAQRGDETIARLLLRHGASVNARGSGGARSTALSAAVLEGQEAIVRLLISRSADMEMANVHGYTPLVLAIIFEHDTMVKLLLHANADINRRGPKGEAPLHLAARRGFEGIADLLLQSNADVDATSDSGATPLMVAVENRKESIIRALLKKGANPSLAAEGRKTPLQEAFASVMARIVLLLLHYGAPARELYGTDGGPLWEAIDEGNEDTVRRLLETGKADVNSRLKNRLTPLMLAKLRRNEAMAQLLISFGARYVVVK